MAANRREGKAPKSIHNYPGLLHSIFAFAQRRGLCEANPVAQADRPARPGSDPDIRYLDDPELTALLAAVPADRWGELERVLYLTAAMTGLRQSELIGLRWQRRSRRPRRSHRVSVEQLLVAEGFHSLDADLVQRSGRARRPLRSGRSGLRRRRGPCRVSLPASAGADSSAGARTRRQAPPEYLQGIGRGTASLVPQSPRTSALVGRISASDRLDHIRCPYVTSWRPPSRGRPARLGTWPSAPTRRGKPRSRPLRGD